MEFYKYNTNARKKLCRVLGIILFSIGKSNNFTNSNINNASKIPVKQL